MLLDIMLEKLFPDSGDVCVFGVKLALIVATAVAVVGTGYAGSRIRSEVQKRGRLIREVAQFGEDVRDFGEANMLRDYPAGSDYLND